MVSRVYVSCNVTAEKCDVTAEKLSIFWRNCGKTFFTKNEWRQKFVVRNRGKISSCRNCDQIEHVVTNRDTLAEVIVKDCINVSVVRISTPPNSHIAARSLPIQTRATPQRFLTGSGAV